MAEMKVPVVKILEASKGMAQKQLYVILTTPVQGLEAVLRNLDEHLKFQVELERRGIMFGAGPFWDDDETHWSGEGMVIVRAESLAAARAIAAEDPMPDTWESIEQAAQHLYRGNPYPGIHYYRWVASHSLRERPDGALVWKWHPSVKERRSTGDVDWWALLKTITPPTLVLRGEESHVLDRDVAERMAQTLPHGRFVEIARAVHTLHEDNPDAVVAALKDFLGS